MEPPKIRAFYVSDEFCEPVREVTGGADDATDPEERESVP
jgi:hypothetical protein